MTTSMRFFFPFVSILLLLLLPLGNSMATVYVYELPDGSKLITDIKQRKSGYKLKKSYKTSPYRSSKKRNAPYYASPIKSKYDALIINAAFKYDLEPSFIKAIVHVESAFDPYAVSRAGAMGLMQVMPGTASEYNLNQDQFNPHKNVDAGVQHLKDLMDRYNKDKTLSLAAYNAGQGAVSKYGGVPPYEETEFYIKKVMQLYKLYKNKI